MLHKESFDFKDTGFFGKLFLDYIDQKTDLKPFFNTLEDFDFEKANISDQQRNTLVEVIKKQSEGLLSPQSTYKLNLLLDTNTYTLTTGHQLNLMGGPLFFTYKILATIRACEELAKTYPNKNFVPIYWMATEDHDFAEINHFYLFGKKHTWEKEVENQSVGYLNLDGIKALLDTITDLPQNIKDAYLSSTTLAEAHRKLVYTLFGAYGIVVLDADNLELKKTLLPIAAQELEQEIVIETVTDTNSKLEALAYKAQVNPRNCNLFYLDQGKRYRIDVQNNEVTLVGSDVKMSKSALLEKFKLNPSLISPNVLLRPVYQELILPNVAYLGGPGELAYWLQLKPLFDRLHVSFPILTPRFFALYLPEFLVKKMQKADFKTSDFFRSFDAQKQEIIESDTAGTELLAALDLEFDQYKKGVLDSLENQINESLKGFAEASLTRIEKEHQNITKRVKKELEARNSIKIDRVKSILDTVFAEGELQERRESAFTYSINNPSFIKQLYNSINPFDQRFQVLSHDETRA